MGLCRHECTSLKCRQLVSGGMLRSCRYDRHAHLQTHLPHMPSKDFTTRKRNSNCIVLQIMLS